MGGLHSWKLLFLLVLLIAPVSLAYSGVHEGPDAWPEDPEYDFEPSDEPDYLRLTDAELVSMQSGSSTNTLYVTQDKSKLSDADTFDGIQAAIDAVPDVQTGRWIIKIDPGVYHGQVEIEKKNFITLYGDPFNPRSVVLEANHTAGDIDSEGFVYGTYRSPSLIVRGTDFTAIGMSFVNLAARPFPGARGGQAVAVRATGDRHQFYNCIFTSFQDTLYAHKGRQLYKNCLIEGSVDFIFGYATAQFEDCNLHARADPYSFTAQKRNLSTDTNGFVFLRANLTCEPSLPGQGQAYLGRAWGVSARTYYIDSYMYDVVYPPGWSNMGYPGRELTAVFGEFNNSGPGADQSQRVSWQKNPTQREADGYRNPARPFIGGDSWVEIPEDLGPTPDPLIMCTGVDESGIAPGPAPVLPGDAEVPEASSPAYNAVDSMLSALDALGDYATFLYFVQSIGLDTDPVLAAANGPLTFFPPTDAAFDLLSPSTVSTLQGDPILLKRVLLYHIVKGFYPDAVLLSLPAQNLDTEAGFSLPIININGVVRIGQDFQAEVTKHDAYVNTAAEAAAQGINKVLLAPFINYFAPPVPMASPPFVAPPVAAAPPNSLPVSSLDSARGLRESVGFHLPSRSWRLTGLGALALVILSLMQ